MARGGTSTGVVPYLDIDGIAVVLGINRQRVGELLGDMSLSGWVEGFAETLAAGLTEGRCRLTSSGLAEAKRRSSLGLGGPTARSSDHQEAAMYDVSVSFAGEDREYVEATVRAMEALGLTVFYDLDHQADLWGKDLGEELHKVYATQSHRVLMFASDDYLTKAIPTHERRSALSRAIDQPTAPYVLQVKLSDVEVPGIPTTQVWADGRVMSPQEIANRVARHLQADSGGLALAQGTDAPALKHIDQELYQDLTELLPSTGVIQQLEVQGLPPSWEPDLLAPLKEFWHNWNNAEHEFQDLEIQALRTDLMAAVDDLLSYQAQNTFQLDNGRQGIPPDWEDTQLARALEVDRLLVEKGDAVVEAHQVLVRGVQKRLD